MASLDRKIYEFGRFRLVPSERLLTSGGEPVTLSNKAFDLLVELVEKRGHLVEKSALLEKIWESSFVEESAVARCVWTVRQALGEDPHHHVFIQTVPKRGYRFIARVTESVALSSSSASVSATGVKGDSGSYVLRSFPVMNDIEDPGPPTNRKDRPSRRAKTSGDNELAEVTGGGRSEDLPDETEPSVPVFSRPRVLAGVTVAAFFAAALLINYIFLMPAPAEAPLPSILVLPARNVSGAREEIFELGLAESIIHRLGSIRTLQVHPIGAVRKYAGRDVNAVAAGRESKTTFVLTSNYLLSDGKIRVTAQLINVSTGEIEKTFKIEKPADDPLTAQDLIANELVQLFELRFPSQGAGPG